MIRKLLRYYIEQDNVELREEKRQAYTRLNAALDHITTLNATLALHEGTIGRLKREKATLDGDARLELSEAVSGQAEMKARLLLSEQDCDRLTAEKAVMEAGFEEQATAIDALHEAQNTGLGNEIARLRIELAEAGAVRATADGAHMCAYPDSAR